MAAKRVVEVEVESQGAGIWWMLAGTALGVAVGVLAAEQMSGRPLRGRALLRQLRRISRMAVGRWEPLVDLAVDMRDAWGERGEEENDEDGEDEDGEDEDGDEDEDDEDGDDEDDDEDGDEEDDDLDDADDSDDAGSPIGERVLEAFLNDPILVERAIEIDADEVGHVVLHGRVRTSRDVVHAVTIAGGVPGVTSVRQRLAVRDRR